MPFAASSSTASEREERVFTAAFGMMDSSQDGEAIAAFMRVREILHRHGGGFRRLLERSHEAERLNEEFGQQNAQLLRENAALRARDSRPVSPAATDARGLLSTPVIAAFKHWDVGLIVIIAAWAGFGLLGATTALSLVAAILICTAFTNWFSRIRFFAGLLLVLAAYGTVAPQPARSPAPTYAVAIATPQSQLYAGAAAPPPAPADAAPQRQPEPSAAPPQTSADPPPHPRAVSDSSRRPPADPRTRHVAAAKADCGPYRLQPGYHCPRSNQWHSFTDFGRLPGMRYE